MTFFLQAFVTLFVIIDPPGIVPVFLGLTRGRPARAVFPSSPTPAHRGTRSRMRWSPGWPPRAWLALRSSTLIMIIRNVRG